LLDQLKRERAQLDVEVAAVSKHIESMRGDKRHASVRLALKIERNKLLVARQKLHHKITKNETEAELGRIFEEVRRGRNVKS